MARSIAYDPTAVQQHLTALFWERGFAETSLADMEAASGLNRRQLYNGFGDKRAMFLQALDDFAAVAARRFLAPLEDENAGLRDIAALLETFLDLAKRDLRPAGCMICSASQDEIAADNDVARRIEQYFDRIRSAYANALFRAKVRGETALTPDELELRLDGLFGTHVALCVLARAGRPHAQLERMVTQSLAGLGERAVT